MKRGLAFVFLFAFILIASSVLAYNGYGYSNYGMPSISDLAQSEWVNAALLFVLIFAVCWFVLEQVFHTSKGAAFVVSIVLALMGSFGTIYYYGVIIPQVGWWVVGLFIAVILAISWQQLRKKGSLFWIILIALALLWLIWLRSQFCPYIFPYMVCIILDVITIAIIIVILFKLLSKYITRSRERLGAQISRKKELRGIEKEEEARRRGEIKAFKEEAKKRRKEKERIRKLEGKQRIKEERKMREREKRRKKELGRIEKKERENRGQEQKRTEIIRRQRSASELQAKWNHYQIKYEEEWNRYQDKARREGLRRGMPSGSSPEGHRRHRYLQAMKAVEKIAKQKGIRLRTTK